MYTTSTAVSPPQPRNWNALYEQQLAGRLRRAHEFVQANQDSPEAILAHFQSLLVLLERGRERPLLHAATLDLVVALHPWPVRWGMIDEWLHILDFAKDIAANDEGSRQSVNILMYLAELLLMVGQFDKALIYGRAAMALARKHAYFQPLAKTGWVLYRLLTALGRAEEAGEVLALVAAEIPPEGSANEGEIEETAVWQTIIQTQALRLGGQHQTGHDRLYPLIVKLAAVDDLVTDYKAEAYAVFAVLLWNMNQYERAARYMTQAVDIYQIIGDHTRIENVQAALSHIYMALGQFEQAEILMRKAIAQSEKKGLYYQMAEQIGSLAGFYIAQGRFAETQPYLQKQIQITEHTDNKGEHVRAIVNRGCVRMLLGAYKDGLADVEIGQSYYQSQNDKQMLTLCKLSTCYAYWRLGELEKGKELAEEIYVTTTTRLTGMPHLALFARRCLALFCPSAEATVLLLEALALARTHGSKMQEAACLLSLGGLTADEDMQNSYWVQGRDLLISIGAHYWLEDHTPQNPPFVGMIH